LWAQGKADAAIHQRRSWEELAKNYDIDVQCWSISKKDRRQEDKDIKDIMVRICAGHSAVHGDESFLGSSGLFG
jgi:hypothetical protein